MSVLSFRRARAIFLSSSALVMASGMPVLAADFQWTGATSTNWYTTTNWTVNGATPALPPKSGDNVTINTLNNAPVLQVGIGTEYTNNLIVGNTASGLLTANATVSGEFITIGAASGGNGTVNVQGSGGAIQFDRMITVGGAGSGTLTMSGGAQGQAGAIVVGNATSGQGTLMLQGAGTQLRTYGTGDNSVVIGNQGAGILSVMGGAKFESNQTIIGKAADGAGVVVIAGAGSEWNGYGDLTVGLSGGGLVNVSDGGHAISGSLSIAQNSGSVGSVALVTGAGSLWNVYNDVAIGGNVSGGGSGGAGQLSVLDGATMTASNMTVGYVTDSQGAAEIDGAGSQLQLTGALKVGNSGAGVVAVTGGATVTADYAMVGVNAAGVGVLGIGGSGSSMTLTNRMTVGAKGDGLLGLFDGGLLTSNGGVIGRDADSAGVVSVAGASVWDNGSNLTVGQDGDAALVIASGGIVKNHTTVIASSATAVGAVSVSGTGSTWTVDGGITVGAQGFGAFSVADGASVTSTASVIAQSAGSVGVADVDGGLWTIDGDLVAGESGAGLIGLANGGVLSAESLTLAENAGSVGILVIGTAPGGTAVRAPGTLSAPTVAFGSGNAQLIFNHTSSDYVFAPVISGTGLISALNGTTILTADNTNLGLTTIASGAEIQVGAGGTSGALGGNAEIEAGGALSFARSDDITFRGTLAGGGVVAQKGPGELRLAADSPNFTGSVEAIGGSVDIDADLRGATAEVGTGATLGGSGMIGDTHVSRGGTFRAGDDSGPITVDGDLDFDQGATYVAVINVDQQPAIVNGTVAFDDTTVGLEFDEGGTLKQDYTLLLAGDITGTFDASVDTLPSQFRGTVSEQGNALKLDLAYVGGNFSFSELGRSVNTQLVKAFNDGVPLQGTLAAGMLQSGTAYEAAMTTLGGELGVNATMSATLGMDSFLRRSSNPNRLLAGWRPVEQGSSDDSVGNAPSTTSGLAYWAVSGRDLYGNAAGDPRWDWSQARRQPFYGPFNPAGTAWLEYNGGVSSVKGDAQAGNSGADIDSNMVEGGYLARLDDANAIGIIFGGGMSTYKQTDQAGKADTQSFHAAVNGVTQSKEGFYATGVVGGGVDSIDTERTVAFGNAIDMLRGSYSAMSVGGRIEAGGRLVQGNVAIIPFAAASAVYTHAPDYSEEVASGLGTSALAYSDVGLFRGTVEAGIGFDTAAGEIAQRFAVNGRVSYLYRYGGGGDAGASFLALPGYGFSISSNAPTGSAVAANVAAKIQLTPQADLSIGAYGEWGADYSALIASAKLRYTW
ncbi:autotransporter domain-containing protein [Martelella limonii]|uniref:autotransporter domain-containing protein n=1 Tax=Martelella limonii TaxID=1647649 RepID=UPI001580BC03|nr:autotransporter domain-containing protein [Martelella limonii]